MYDKIILLYRIMYKGYRNLLSEKDQTNKTLNTLHHIIKCTKCRKFNHNLHSKLTQYCLFCGNPLKILNKIT
jgi:rRNA maturation endonuclease Nob1